MAKKKQQKPKKAQKLPTPIKPKKKDGTLGNDYSGY